MTKIRITSKEYANLLRIAHCSEFYLSDGLETTKNRLKEYLNEFNNFQNK